MHDHLIGFGWVLQTFQTHHVVWSQHWSIALREIESICNKSEIKGKGKLWRVQYHGKVKMLQGLQQHIKGKHNNTILQYITHSIMKMGGSMGSTAVQIWYQKGHEIGWRGDVIASLHTTLFKRKTRWSSPRKNQCLIQLGSSCWNWILIQIGVIFHTHKHNIPHAPIMEYVRGPLHKMAIVINSYACLALLYWLDTYNQGNYSEPPLSCKIQNGIGCHW